jgi:hypothetical protein
LALFILERLRMLGLKRFTKPLAMAGTALILLGLAVPAAQAVPGEDNSNIFWQMLCTIDHFGPDDPIVFPGQPGDSHMHSFYGNTTTNASSTAASLMAASSSCGRNMQTSDRSAYWIPSLYQKNANGSLTLVKNSDQQMFIYYRRPGGTGGPKVQPFPPGLQMLAGNSQATSPQPLWMVQWDCSGGQEYPSMPQCPGGPSNSLHASIEFPSCWDGTQLDSADHRSHMAYANPDTGACPAGHPVSLPQITYEIDYPGITGGSQYTLSSHGLYSMHADFIAAWDPQVQNALVTGCLNAGLNCIDVSREGGQLVAGDSNPVTLTLANYPATSQVLPAPTTHAPATHAPTRHAATTHAPTRRPPARHAPSPTAAPTLAALPALATMPAAATTPATTASPAFPATRAMGLAGGAIGLSLLAFAGYLLFRRLRGHHDRRIRWPS